MQVVRCRLDSQTHQNSAKAAARENIRNTMIGTAYLVERSFIECRVKHGDFGHVPLAEIRIELAGTRKCCIGCHDVELAIRQQRRQLKKNLLSDNIVTLDKSHLLRSALNWPASSNAAQEAMIMSAMRCQQSGNSEGNSKRTYNPTNF